MQQVTYLMLWAEGSKIYEIGTSRANMCNKYTHIICNKLIFCGVKHFTWVPLIVLIDWGALENLRWIVWENQLWFKHEYKECMEMVGRQEISHLPLPQGPRWSLLFVFFCLLAAGPGETYTDYVATRWYRAPELLVGETRYGRYASLWCLLMQIIL